MESTSPSLIRLSLLLICLQPVGWTSETADPPAARPLPWRGVLERLSADRDRLSGHLDAAHEMLLRRARKERPDLVERLSREPPALRPRGYGVLPKIEADPPLAAVKTRETVFSLESLERNLHRDLSDAQALIDDGDPDPVAPLDLQLEEFERLRERLDSVEKGIAYHAQWQQAVGDQGAYFTQRNRLVASVREWREKHAVDETTDLDEATLEAIAPFRSAEGLSIEETKDGGRMLAVTIWTDIEDRDLLAAFREGVEANFTGSEAARARKFHLALEIRTIAPDVLYPQRPPSRGADIDLARHLTRFPEGVLVLTTGADSTHAWQGRFVALGSAPLSRRVLAHEFGHLLGFSDAYLRGFDGDRAGPYGATVVEWHGLVDDLMGNPDKGRVTEAMIDRLIEAYGQP